MAQAHNPAAPGPRHGVTIIEMMVVVVVLAIILSLAVPSLRELLARQRVKGINAELVTDLQYARSEAVSRNREVYVTFRMDDKVGEPPMTCYTVHTLGTVGDCDCRKPMGSSCLDNAGLPNANMVELKTVQVLRSTTVTFQAPASPANDVGFSRNRGLTFWSGHAVGSPNYVTAWADFPVDVQSSISGQLRTSIHITGRPQVCSPDGSINGVPTCP